MSTRASGERVSRESRRRHQKVTWAAIKSERTRMSRKEGVEQEGLVVGQFPGRQEFRVRASSPRKLIIARTASAPIMNRRSHARFGMARSSADQSRFCIRSTGVDASVVTPIALMGRCLPTSRYEAPPGQQGLPQLTYCPPSTSMTSPVMKFSVHGSQEGNDLGDVLRRANAAEGNCCQNLVMPSVEEFACRE